MPRMLSLKFLVAIHARIRNEIAGDVLADDLVHGHVGS